MKAFALLVVLAACPKTNEHKKTIEPTSGSDAGRQLLPNDAAQAGSAAVTAWAKPAAPSRHTTSIPG